LKPRVDEVKILSPRISFFLRAKFSSFFFNLKNMLSTHTNDFCGKIGLNPHISIYTIARSLQQVPVGSQNIKIFLQFFYFHIWPIAKFGEIFLWMIAILATSQS
jgi:hypothetical protein